MFRRILGDNPYGAKEGRNRNKVYDAILAALKKVKIDVQARTIKLKSEQFLDSSEQKKKETPPCGTEEPFGEYEQLLDEVLTLRATEAERLTKEAEVAGKKNSSKEQTVDARESDS